VDGSQGLGAAIGAVAGARRECTREEVQKLHTEVRDLLAGTTFRPSQSKELHTRSKTFAPQSTARASFVPDVDRIEK
jgi:hypothetical protein